MLKQFYIIIADKLIFIPRENFFFNWKRNELNLTKNLDPYLGFHIY